MTYEQDLRAYKEAIDPTIDGFQVGAKVFCTWSTYGEEVYDRKGNLVHQKPVITQKLGRIYFIGEEITDGNIVFRCKTVNTVKGMGEPFQFYLKDLGCGSGFTAHLEEKK